MTNQSVNWFYFQNTHHPKGGLEKAENALSTHKDALEAVTKKLLEVETLEQEEYETLIKKYGIEPKKA